MGSPNLNLKERRESKNLSISFIASKLGLTESVLLNLENNNLTAEIYPFKVKISYVKRYAEFLEFSAKDINNELIRLTSAHNKKRSKGYLNWFDYLNRLVILILFCVLIYSVYLLYLENKMIQDENMNNESALIIEADENHLPVVEEVTIIPTNQPEKAPEIIETYQSETISPDDSNQNIEEVTLTPTINEAESIEQINLKQSQHK